MAKKKFAFEKPPTKSAGSSKLKKAGKMKKASKAKKMPKMPMKMPGGY